jgi:cytochrome c oxidase subunit 3
MNLHLFVIIGYSWWPIIFAVGLFYILTGLCFFVNFGNLLVLYIGVLLLSSVSYFWLLDASDEAVYGGNHTRIVRNSLMKGFLLFLVSEVMLFFGFF